MREDSLGSQMSKPQLLVKRKWSEDMTRNVRMSRESLRKCAKVRGDVFAPKAAKAAKVSAFGDA